MFNITNIYDITENKSVLLVSTKYGTLCSERVKNTFSFIKNLQMIVKRVTKNDLF